MSYLKTVNELFPIRRTIEEKKRFEEYALEKGKELGYISQVQELEKHRNLVFGDLSSAKVIFGAHYDTPTGGLIPNLMMPRNNVLFFAYQFLIPILLVVLGLSLAYGLQNLFHYDELGVILIFLLIYYGFFILLFKAFKNPHNLNDNTSGVAGVFTLMEKLSGNQEVAFVLFDDEEKGKKGSKALYKAYPNYFDQKLVINMDCIGNGDNIILISSLKAMKLNEYHKLANCFQSNQYFKVASYPAKGSQCNSDQKSFPCGIAILAAKRRPIIGFYTPRIHTVWDKVASFENIEFIANNLKNFVDKLGDDNV